MPKSEGINRAALLSPMMVHRFTEIKGIPRAQVAETDVKVCMARVPGVALHGMTWHGARIA